jgi:hypothetical protein
MQTTYGILVLLAPLILYHRIPDLSHLRVFGCNVWYRQGSQAKFRTLNCDKAIIGTFISFEGTHIVRALNGKGRIILATAAHFQEQRTTPPGRAKRQCLEPLDHLDEDFDLPFRNAWFNNPDSQDLGLEAAAQPEQPTRQQERPQDNQQLVPQTPSKARQHNLQRPASGTLT